MNLIFSTSWPELGEYTSSLQCMTNPAYLLDDCEMTEYFLHEAEHTAYFVCGGKFYTTDFYDLPKHYRYSGGAQTHTDLSALSLSHWRLRFSLSLSRSLSNRASSSPPLQRDLE